MVGGGGWHKRRRRKSNKNVLLEVARPVFSLHLDGKGAMVFFHSWCSFHSPKGGQKSKGQIYHIIGTLYKILHYVETNACSCRTWSSITLSIQFLGESLSSSACRDRSEASHSSSSPSSSCLTCKERGGGRKEMD